VFYAEQDGWNDPALGKLPAAHIDLNDETDVKFLVHINRLELFSPVQIPEETKWSWRVIPLRLESSPASKEPASPTDESRLVVGTARDRSVEIEPTYDPAGAKSVSDKITLTFHATNEGRAPVALLSDPAGPDTTFTLRNRGKGSGKEFFLLELTADWGRSKDRILGEAAHTFGSESCSAHDAVENHLRLARSRAPVARFLLQVSWAE
jgi:hypothetical protein